MHASTLFVTLALAVASTLAAPVPAQVLPRANAKSELTNSGEITWTTAGQQTSQKFELGSSESCLGLSTAENSKITKLDVGSQGRCFLMSGDLCDGDIVGGDKGFSGEVFSADEASGISGAKSVKCEPLNVQPSGVGAGVSSSASAKPSASAQSSSVADPTPVADSTAVANPTGTTA